MSRLDDLREMRLILIDTVDEVEPDRRASVVAELRRVLAEIDELEAAGTGQRGTVLDELTARRAARRTGTAG